jgi:hypothetical protein
VLQQRARNGPVPYAAESSSLLLPARELRPGKFAKKFGTPLLF